MSLHFLAQKAFNPTSRINREKVWLAEQKVQNDRQKGQERSQILKEEHELMLARQKSEGTSLELQQLDFMYNVPEELYNAPVQPTGPKPDAPKQKMFGNWNAHVQCFTCGQMGHMTGDRKCPGIDQVTDPELEFMNSLSEQDRKVLLKLLKKEEKKSKKRERREKKREREEKEDEKSHKRQKTEEKDDHPRKDEDRSSNRYSRDERREDDRYDSRHSRDGRDYRQRDDRRDERRDDRRDDRYDSRHSRDDRNYRQRDDRRDDRSERDYSRQKRRD